MSLKTRLLFLRGVVALRSKSTIKEVFVIAKVPNFTHCHIWFLSEIEALKLRKEKQVTISEYTQF